VFSLDSFKFLKPIFFNTAFNKQSVKQQFGNWHVRLMSDNDDEEKLKTLDCL